MKTKLAAVAGAAILAASASLPANAAVVLGGEDGWEVSYGGFINLFYNQHDFDFTNGTSEDSSHLNEGLLPAFHTMTVKTPEVNGLRGTGQITFAVDSSGPKTQRLNKGGTQIDMREVFFNVEGDFGTISAGRTLSLFQRQAILKDMTLFGMGALGGPDGGGTSLGRIGFGYVYPDFRTRFTYKTPDINGFNLEVGIFDPQEPTATFSAAGANTGTGFVDANGNGMQDPGEPNVSVQVPFAASGFGAETDTPQFQAEATYTTQFEGGSFNIWAGLLWQEQTITASGMGGTGKVESFGYNVGADVSLQGFNVVGSFYDGEALGSLLFNVGGGNGFICGMTSCAEADNQGYYIQGSYTFNGKTKLGVSYGASRQDAVNNTTLAAIGAPLNTGAGVKNELLTVGVYHDVTSWLKVVAEYNDYESNQLGIADANGFSVGGFLLW